MSTMKKQCVKHLMVGKKMMILVFLDKMVLSLAGKTGMRSVIISVEGANGEKYMGKESFPS